MIIFLPLGMSHCVYVCVYKRVVCVCAHVWRGRSHNFDTSNTQEIAQNGGTHTRTRTGEFSQAEGVIRWMVMK